jgi:hypothetical protein
MDSSVKFCWTPCDSFRPIKVTVISIQERLYMNSDSPSLSIEERREKKTPARPNKKRKLESNPLDLMLQSFQAAGDQIAAYYQGLVDASTLDRNNDTMTDAVRTSVWDSYFPNVRTALCPCCQKMVISESAARFSYQTFDAGHIFPRSRGGTLELANLIPVCKKCNTDMGTQHLYSYAWKKYGVALWRS